MSKSITVTWDSEQGGRLVARCQADHTLNSNVVRWFEPINAKTDSHAVAHAVTEINGAQVLSVDHDGEYVHIEVAD